MALSFGVILGYRPTKRLHSFFRQPVARASEAFPSVANPPHADYDRSDAGPRTRRSRECAPANASVTGRATKLNENNTLRPRLPRCSGRRRWRATDLVGGISHRAKPFAETPNCARAHLRRTAIWSRARRPWRLVYFPGRWQLPRT